MESGIEIRIGDVMAVEIPPFHLCVTSPPYNLGKPYEPRRSHEEYLAWTAGWLRRLRESALVDSRVCLNIPLDTKDKVPMYADVLRVALATGWQYRTTIIWHDGYTKKRTAWGSWRSASAPNIPTAAEMIIVLYAEQWTRAGRGTSDISAEEFMSWTSGVWSFPPESAKRIGHPAPFPLELPKRCIKLFSYVGDQVIDPFLGSGTTALAAQMLNRRFFGIEFNPDYLPIIQKRLAQQFSLPLDKY